MAVFLLTVPNNFIILQYDKRKEKRRKKKKYKMATAIVEWGEDKKSISVGFIRGKVEFTQFSPQHFVKVYLRIEGLPNGIHGFHIHEKPLDETEGDVMDCCDKLGGHFNVGEKWSLENQSGTKHGNGLSFNSESGLVEQKGECHTGDLCNNIVVDDNFCELSFIDPKISLFQDDENCIIGRSLVIHQGEDDMGLIEYQDEKKNVDRYITGNAGRRIACGNIELKLL